jgi:hypothetical protein
MMTVVSLCYPSSPRWPSGQRNPLRHDELHDWHVLGVHVHENLEDRDCCYVQYIWDANNAYLAPKKVARTDYFSKFFTTFPKPGSRSTTLRELRRCRTLQTATFEL